MSTQTRLLLPILAVALGSSVPAQTQSSGQPRVFIGAHVIGIGGAPDIPDGVIFVEGGKITRITSAASARVARNPQTVDLEGKFVVPGFVSAHAHISDVNGLKPRAYTSANTLRQLGVFARYGITSVWSLGGEDKPAYEARAAQMSPTLDRSRIFLADRVISGKTPADALKILAEVATRHPDVIKIRVDDNLGTVEKMKPEVYRAVIADAHKRGLRVAAHIFYLDDAKDLLQSGVDAIVHSVRDKDVDDEFISLMKRRQAGYVPTLTREISTFVYESTPPFFNDPFFLKEADPAVVASLETPAKQAEYRSSASAQRYKVALDVARRNLKRIVDAGILVGMGTDTGPFPERFEGYFEHLEMEMMVQAGMTPAQVLKAATSDGARVMGVDGIGTLKPGSWADMVVLDGDPRTDITSTRRIHSVWIAGNRVARP
jgi:imidazolonepropionase-like amidohydrolase